MLLSLLPWKLQQGGWLWLGAALWGWAYYANRPDSQCGPGHWQVPRSSLIGWIHGSLKLQPRDCSRLGAFLGEGPTLLTGLHPNAAQPIHWQALRSGLTRTRRNVSCANNCSWGAFYDWVLLWERGLILIKACLPMWCKPFMDKSSEVVEQAHGLIVKLK